MRARGQRVRARVRRIRFVVVVDVLLRCALAYRVCCCVFGGGWGGSVSAPPFVVLLLERAFQLVDAVVEQRDFVLHVD